MDKKEEAALFPTVGAAEGQLPYNYYEPIIPYEEPQCNTPDIKIFSEIEAATVDWLWYPYIPFGKVTIIQGDPGEGKTTLALNIAAILSRGERLPTELEYTYTYDSITSIYQTAEDGLADTIKPRLTGACFYPAELVYKKCGEYHKLEKQYFIMEVVGKAEIDFEAMGVKCSLCEFCGHFVFEGPLCSLFTKKGIYPTIIKKDSWDGSDVFNNNDCTERFVKTILKAGLSGYEFIDYKQKYDAFDKKVYFKTLKEFNKISTLKVEKI